MEDASCGGQDLQPAGLLEVTIHGAERAPGSVLHRGCTAVDPGLPVVGLSYISAWEPSAVEVLRARSILLAL